MSEITYCSQCGARLIGDEVYCRHCGSKINWEPLEFVASIESVAMSQQEILNSIQEDQVASEDLGIQEIPIQPSIKQPEQEMPPPQNNTSKLEQIQAWFSKVQLPQLPSLPKPSLSDPKVKYTLIGIVGVIAVAVGVLLSGIGVDSGTYAVEFNPNGGSGGPSSIEVKKNQLVTKPKAEPTLSGYEFTGWFTDSQGQYRYNFRTPVDKDRILYAGWEEDANPVTAVSERPKTVGEFDQAKETSPSYFVTARSNNGIYVRREPFVPNKINSNSVMYINQGDTTVHLTNLNQKHLDKHGYTWFKVESPNGNGWVREDIVRGVN